MGAIGNYEVITEPFDMDGSVNDELAIVVDVPSGKVALGWGYEHTAVLDTNGNPVSGVLNRDLIISGHPASDGSSVTFAVYEAQSGVGRSVGTLYVTCAEMGC